MAPCRYEPLACCTYQRRRVACSQGPARDSHGLHVPPSGVPSLPRAARATTGAQSLEAALTDLGGATRLAAACDQQDTSYCQRIVHVLQEMGN